MAERTRLSDAKLAELTDDTEPRIVMELARELQEARALLYVLGKELQEAQAKLVTAKAEERARIVAWLRGYIGHADGEWARAARWFAARLGEEATQ